MHALTHTAGYAIVALSFVGCNGERWVQSQEIAANTNIPKPYLSKILHALGKAGLIRTKRGKGGGVRLARAAEEVTLLDVARAVESADGHLRCFLGMRLCCEEKPCPIHEFWKTVRLQTREQVSRTTLAQVAVHQSLTGFQTPPLAQLLDDLPLPWRIYNGKPTGRFMRKFATPRSGGGS